MASPPSSLSSLPPPLPAGKQRVWPQCIATGSAALAACLALGFSLHATLGWSLLALYLPSFVDGSEYTGERYWPWFADLCRRRLMTAVPMTLVCEEKIDPESQYIFASHPHGILSVHHGGIMAGSSKPSFHDISPMHTRNDLAASVVFRLPFYREWLLWLGCVDAGRPTAESVLKKGKSLVILIGGIAEQMLSQRGEQVVYAKKRKGHVRLALKYGVPIVPSYAFGETELYTHSKFLLSFRQWVAKKFSLALLVAYGDNKWMPFAPRDGVVLNQVLGKPIRVTKMENPTQEDIDKVHEQYVEELVRIFNKYKKQYGYGDQQLQVV